ncbi:lysophospholipid acyltransferase family protein [Tanticharoenia sakaeratensis]|uniref:Lipid A biosynthesis lauroyl acyltransferase n=1 Tax=Tanticharoenia sakaeratensis NBRC 103193 TaxID=1231623 RepID=A0A0D6MI19_9PROT|nr:lauroyl acyltransferase [Tanticharoenia sakaeratensis]GAN53252.1 lipid A biosynthesis lauroyl acyltransferase [Tanticharoenia sakaeratensis NBRC 103193]GBQ21182.1 lipid A biosynthesis lauroyl acyltransferase [Tanticharoenia sakaeratensis NBRC 103193]
MSESAPKIRLQHRIEAGLASGVLALLRKLGPARASDFGGRVARLVGPRLPVSRIAARNLTLAMPWLGGRAHRRIIRDMWENLGRTVGEFPHIAGLERDTAAGPGWRLLGEEMLIDQAARGGAALFVSGHIGNWEVMPPVCARYGLAFAPFYRAADNPLVDRMVRDLRREAMGIETPLFPKGAKGAREALLHIARGGHLGVLSDQKMNDGIEARLFGYPAMTPSAAAAFSLKYRAPIVLGHVRRDGPARFTLTVDRVLTPEPGPDRKADIQALTQTINDRMEAWIREVPASWLWMHRRFPKAFYRPEK